MATTTPNNQGSIPLINQGPAYQAHFQNQFPVTENHKEFPVRTLKVLGSVQIGLGVVLGILSIVGIVLDVIAMHRDCDMDYYTNSNYFSSYYSTYWMCSRRDQYSHNLFAFDITCLVLSGWYVLTGFLPLCMSRKRESSWGGLRVGFMVCSIIGASIFVPTMFSLGVIGAIMRGNYDGKVVVLSAFMAVLSFAEFVVSIIGASYCCCCTPWKRTDQTIRVIYAAQPGLMCNLPQSAIPMTGGQQNLFYAVGQSGNPVIVQYPRAQQYQVIATNTAMIAPTQVAGTNQADTNSSLPMQVPVDPPAYKE